MDVEDNVKIGQSPPSSLHGPTIIDALEEKEALDVLENHDEYTGRSFLPKIQNTLFKPPQNENEPENKTALDCGMSSLIVDISKLPPLANPNYSMIRQESNVGITVVLFLSLAFIGVTHGISLAAVGGIEKHSPTWWTFFILVYGETGIALLCLLGLMLVDPGVVKRSPENCFPIPMQCEAWIQAHVDDDAPKVEPPPEYYIASSNPSTPGDTYCRRCLLWRRFKHSNKYFHCSICQRCVAEFDHHCSVFGRCIGGTLLSRTGNYKFFVTIVAMGFAGYLTSIVSLVWSLSLRYKPQIAIPVCLFCLWLTTGILMGKICNGVCLSCRAFAISCTNQLRQLLKA